jgi:hypothetical protein
MEIVNSITLQLGAECGFHWPLCSTAARMARQLGAVALTDTFPPMTAFTTLGS